MFTPNSHRSGRARHRITHASALGIATVLIATLGTVTTSAAVEEHGHLAEQYTLELLHPLNNGVASAALDINQHGDVVGITRPAATAKPQYTAFWQRHNDHFHAYQLPNLEGSDFSRGFSVNAAARIVGEAFNSTGASVPITWSASRQASQITVFNDEGTGILTDINDAGVAVGTASARAVRLNATGGVTVLPTPQLPAGATLNTATAQAIANNGTIAGRVSIAVPHEDHFHNELHAVTWSPDGVGTLLSMPTGTSAPSVADITDEGVVVGTVKLNGKDTATVWQADDSATVLATPTVLDYTHAAATAAHDDIVVGYVSKYAGNYLFGGAAVAWDAHGPVNLNTRVIGLPESTVLQAANGVNASGQIVGTASTEGGARGFVLTPVPSASPHEAPQITSQPSSATVIAGNAASFTAGASGEPTPTVQWESSADNGNSWAAIEGANQHTLTLPQVTADKHGNQYRAVFTNVAGTAVTNPVALTVTAPLPEKPDAQPSAPAAATLDAAAEGGIAIDKVSVMPGETITVQLDAGVYANQWVAAWIFSDPSLLGNDWQRVSANGAFSVQIAATAAPGAHRVAVFTPQGSLVGWRSLQVTRSAQTESGASDTGLARTGATLPIFAISTATLLMLAGGTVLLVRRRRNHTRNS